MEVRTGPAGFALAGVEVHQVDVGGVVELAAAELAERDGDEAALDFDVAGADERAAEAPYQVGADVVVGAFEQGVGEVRELEGDLGERRGAEQVAQGYAENLHPAEAGQSAGGLLIVEAGCAGRRVRSAARGR